MRRRLGRRYRSGTKYRKLLPSLPSAANSSTPKWSRPSLEFIKCNLDASLFRNYLLHGLGACNRNSQGTFVADLSCWFKGLLPPMEAEDRALSQVITWLLNNNFTKVILEIDCQQLVDTINTSYFQKNEVGDILKLCVSKCSSFENCSI
ncbi:hypothetical protein JHK84_030987 [Glycine max]|nr:hypothetical protein JHK86_030860 [Glycine max]KAG5145444.1 hypothetical protein JHK84_030987 [Glycine max]